MEYTETARMGGLATAEKVLGLTDRLEQMNNEAAEASAMLHEICLRVGSSTNNESQNVGNSQVMDRNLHTQVDSLASKIADLRSRANQVLNAL